MKYFSRYSPFFSYNKYFCATKLSFYHNCITDILISPILDSLLHKIKASTKYLWEKRKVSLVTITHIFIASTAIIEAS